MANPPRHAPPPTRWRTFEAPAEPSPVSFGSTLGALAVAVGIGVLGVYMLDLHGHTCDKCGRRWRHFGAFNLGDEASHTCSSCGQVQWWKCGAPHVLRGSQFAQPPTAPPMRGPSDVPALAPASRAAPGVPVIPAAFPAVFSSPPSALNGLPSPASPPMAAIQQWRRPW